MDTPVSPETIAIVCAHNEADRLADTIATLQASFAQVEVVVADDGSTDGTAEVAERAGARVVRSVKTIGKGGAATLAAQTVLHRALEDAPPVFLLVDGDLGETAGKLVPLADAVRAGRCDLAVAVFATKVGGGFGFAVGYAHKAIKKLCGADTRAPISGQRALSGPAFATVVPFAPRFGMEIGMTVDAVRAGYRLEEIELELAHRATGRSLRGFLHRGRQLLDFFAVYANRR